MENDEVEHVIEFFVEQLVTDRGPTHFLAQCHTETMLRKEPQLLSGDQDRTVDHRHEADGERTVRFGAATMLAAIFARLGFQHRAAS